MTNIDSILKSRDITLPTKVHLVKAMVFPFLIDHPVLQASALKDTCSLQVKLCYLHSILKSRDITLPTKVHLVKAMVFPVVMYGCENCTIKKAEH